MTCVSRLKLVAESPKYRLLDILVERGWYNLYSKVWLDKQRLRSNPFQEVAVRLLVWGGGILEQKYASSRVYSEEYRGRELSFLAGKGSDYADSMYADKPPYTVTWRDLLDSIATIKPLIVVDFTWFPKHRLEKEIESLRRQVAYALNVIRDYLWDAHLLLTGLRPGVTEWLSLMLGRAKIQYSVLEVSDALEVRGYRNVVVLDPSADEVLRASEVLEAEAFIVGGIVDRIPVRGATQQIAKKIPWAKRRKILFRGDVFGVPNRLNAIIEAILKARYETCGDIDEAIRRVMSPRDARLRAYVEISRLLRGKPPSERVVPASFYCELAKWLPLKPKDFIIAARMAQARVSGNPLEACREYNQ